MVESVVDCDSAEQHAVLVPGIFKTMSHSYPLVRSATLLMISRFQQAIDASLPGALYSRRALQARSRAFEDGGQ